MVRVSPLSWWCRCRRYRIASIIFSVVCHENDCFNDNFLTSMVLQEFIMRFHEGTAAAWVRHWMSMASASIVWANLLWVINHHNSYSGKYIVLDLLKYWKYFGQTSKARFNEVDSDKLSCSSSVWFVRLNEYVRFFSIIYTLILTI